MHHYIRSKCIHFASFLDRKSTRLNSSHSQISYAVFCLKKKKKTQELSRLSKNCWPVAVYLVTTTQAPSYHVTKSGFTQSSSVRSGITSIGTGPLCVIR